MSHHEVCPNTARRERARRNGITPWSFLCPCQWGPGLASQTAVGMLIRAGQDDPEWRALVLRLAALFADADAEGAAS